MSDAYFNLASMYRLNHYLFDDMKVPESIDKETLVNLLFGKYLENEVLYKDPQLLQDLIRYWSLTRLSSWQQMEKALTLEYNINDNTRRTTELKTSTTGQSEADTSSNANDKNENFKNGFNNGQMLANDRTLGNSSGSASTKSNAKTDVISSETTYGSIGVVTSQEMIKQELELRKKYNLYDIIATEFGLQFILMVY